MVTIRALRPEDDLRALIPLSTAFFQEYAAHHELFELGEVRDEDIIGFFARSVGVEDGVTYIALESDSDGGADPVIGPDVLIGPDAVVGYVTAFVREQAPFYRIRKVGAISGLMVRADHRRQGLGARLVAEAARFFREKGATYYTVYTSAANESALRRYQRAGLAPLHLNLVAKCE